MSGPETIPARLLPPLTHRSSLPEILRVLRFYSVLTVLLLLAYAWMTKDIHLMGFTVQETGEVQPGLVVVAFVNGCEAGRTVSSSSEWDSTVPTTVQAKRVANFDLKLANEFGYSPDLQDLTVFRPVEDLRVGRPYSEYAPSGDLLQVVALEPGEGGAIPLRPLRLQTDGSVVPMAGDDCPPSTQATPPKVTRSLTLRILVPALASLTSNIVASYLQAKYRLIDDPWRLLLVLVFYVVAAILSPVVGN